MEIDKLLQIASEFRKAIERVIEEKTNPNNLLDGFPKGKCSLISELFQRYLHEIHGEEVLFVTSSRDCPESHAWLETDAGIIIDITGDQYCKHKDEFFCDVPVYVGPMDSFHKAFGTCTKTYYVEIHENPLVPVDLFVKKKNEIFDAIIKEMNNSILNNHKDK